MSFVAKLCVYKLKGMYGRGNILKIVDWNQDAPTEKDFPQLKDYDLDFVGYVFYPELRPLRPNIKINCVDNSPAWPYHTIDTFVELDPIDVKPQENRVRFISYINGVENTVPLYIYRMTDRSGYLFSLDKNIPENAKRAFNPNIWIMPEPYLTFECKNGLVKPTLGRGKDIFNALRSCEIDAYSDNPGTTLSNVESVDFGEKSNIIAIGLVIVGFALLCVTFSY